MTNNIINNAIKFTESGYIEFGYTIENDKIRVYGKDTGIGIPKKYHEKVFNRFEKVSNFSQGVGLGLSIYKKIVEFKKGKIEIISDGKHSSEIWFSFLYKKYL